MTTRDLTGVGTVYRLYIGASEVRSAVDRQLVYNFISKHFDGATFTDGRGMYRGTFEDSLTVTIATVKKLSVLVGLIEELKELLSQESIGLEIDNILYFI